MNWTVEGRGDEFAIVDDMGVEVASVPYTDETGAEPLDTAEGRRAVLLASAPDLLAALEAHIAYEESVTATIAAISGEKFQEAPWLAAARKAIALAKGQTEEDELERARR